MKIKPFQLERWLLNSCEINLGGATILQLRLKALTDSIDPNTVLTYKYTNGSPTIRRLIADLYTDVNEESVLVTSGTAEANYLTLNRLLSKGDEVIAILPAYMQCVGIAKHLGARVKTCNLIEEENRYRIDVQKLEELVSEKTKLVSLINPNNPTGSVISTSEMRSVCEIASRVGAWVLCDGALRGLEIDGDMASTPVGIYEKGIATGSLSKVGLMGLRIGWLVAPNELVKGCWAYKDYTTLSHSGIGEQLATIALKKKKFDFILRRARDFIRSHRSILSDWINENSSIVEWIPSQAGHTGFLKYNLNIGDVELCKRLLSEEELLLSPGDFFGLPNHVRLRYSCEEDKLVTGLNRFGAFLRQNAS